LDRREFVVSALALSILSPSLSRAATPTDADEVLLNRLTFGATADDRARLAQLGKTAWLDDQLARPAHDPEIDQRIAGLRLRISYEAGDEGNGVRWDALDELRPLTAIGADPATLLPLLDWEKPMAYAERARPGDEVICASLTRAVHAPAQLREVMTQFWHDHFNVHAQKHEFVAVFFPAYDATLRDHALGNFRALLGAVARSPSMLYYLNNDESRASPANENFARELLELHTLGASNYVNDRYSHWSEVPGAAEGLAAGYLDDDVYEVARAFTGWTVGDGRWIADGTEAPHTGQFAYIQTWHDPYQKRILGREFPDHRAPMADGDEVLDMLADHPGTARFICTKIARRLLSDDPDPALVDRLAAVFLNHSKSPDQIAKVIRALVDDPAFSAPPTKMRRPFEFLAALYRASGVEVAAPENAFHWQLSRAGWLQHTFPPPTGHPDRSEAWNTGSTMLRLVDLALYAHDDWFGCTATRLSDVLPKSTATVADLVDHWCTRLHGAASDPLPELLAGFGANPSDPMPDDASGRHDLSTVTIAFAALSPRFLFR
jgi:uncharacterized protein (DUF1800 family)